VSEAPPEPQIIESPAPDEEHPDRKLVTTGRSSYYSYQLTEEERERLNQVPNQHTPKTPHFQPFTMTREEYLIERANGHSRHLIAAMKNTEMTVLKGYLIKWGLIDIVVEKAEIAKILDERPVVPTPEIPEKKRTLMTKEMIEMALLEGKSVTQIAQELKMKPNALCYQMKKMSIPIPKKEKTSKDFPNVTSIRQRKVTTKKGVPHPKMTKESQNNSPFLSLAPPLTTGDRQEQMQCFQSKLNIFAKEISSERINRRQAARALYELNQSFSGLIHAELTDLVDAREVERLHRDFFASFQDVKQQEESV
jgi:hypothetical protein